MRSTEKGGVELGRGCEPGICLSMNGVRRERLSEVSLFLTIFL